MNDLINTHIKPLIGQKKLKKNKKDLQLIEGILSNLEYFKNLSRRYPKHYKSLCYNLISHFQFIELKRLEKLWDYNQKVNSIYIIIQGSVNIYKSKIIGEIEQINNIENFKKMILEKRNHHKSNSFHKNGNSLIRILEREIIKQSFYINYYKQKEKLTDRYQEIENDINKAEDKNETPNYRLSKRKSEMITKNINTNKLKRFSLDISALIKNEKISEVLSEGQVLGEDYINNNMPYRKDKVTVKTYCILAELSKTDYESIFVKLNAIEKANMILFLKSLNLFVDKYNFIEKIQKQLISRTYKKGQIIFLSI